MKRLLDLAIAMALCIGSAAQTTFEEVIAWPMYDAFLQARETADGGFMGVGISSGVNVFDVRIVRTDANGDTLWSRIHDVNQGFDYARSFAFTDDGGALITGYTSNDDTESDALMIMRIDALGDTLFVHWVDGPEQDNGVSIERTADGGFIIVGRTNSFGAGDDDVLLVKADAAGAVLWQQTLGGADSEIATDVQPMDDGGFLITGAVFPAFPGESDLFLMRTDAGGTVQWTRTYGGVGLDGGNAALLVAGGGAWVVGYRPDAQSEPDAWVLRIDAAGDTLGTFSFDQGLGGCTAADIVGCDLGGFGVLWNQTSAQVGTAGIIFHDATGNAVVTSAWGLPTDLTSFSSIAATSDGVPLMAGLQWEGGTGGGGSLTAADMLLVKGGALLCTLPTAIPVLHAPGLRCYPSPFTGSLTISIGGIAQSGVVWIHDVLGRPVRQLPVEGANELIWDGRDASGAEAPAGLYLIRVQGAPARAVLKG